MAGTYSGKALIPWLIVLGLWAVLHGAMATKVDPRVLDWELTGPDEYMRLVRMVERRGGTGSYDTVMERSNAPCADTRPPRHRAVAEQATVTTAPSALSAEGGYFFRASSKRLTR
jgi:hypothetical protein